MYVLAPFIVRGEGIANAVPAYKYQNLSHKGAFNN